MEFKLQEHRLLLATTSIEDLPEEILVNIFKKLDFKSLKEVVLTCKTWKTTVEQSSIRWNMLVPMHHQESDSVAANELNNSLRRFKKAKMRRWQDLFYLCDAFDNKSNRLKEVDFYSTELKYQALRILLTHKKLPDLVKIDLGHNRNSAHRGLTDSDDSASLQEFPKLKTIVLPLFCAAYLSLFKKAKIHTLIVSADGLPEFAFMKEALLEFFAKQPCLKTFKLESSLESTANSLFRSPFPIENVPFKLEKLSLIHFKLEDANDYFNVFKFMQMHKESLETLELGIGVPEIIYELVFSKLRRLKKLLLVVNDLPRELEFYERLEVNQSVTSLTLLESVIAKSNASAQIINSLPNIKNLTVTGTPSFLKPALPIAGSLKHLKHLKTLIFGYGTMELFDFPELESLAFLDTMDRNRSRELREFLKNKKLRKLVYDGYVDDNMFPDDFKHLESVDLKKSLIQRRLPETAGIRGLHLREDDFFDDFRFEMKSIL